MILKEFGFKPLPIEFTKKGHRYKLNDFLLTGSSSITGMKKQDWAAPWAAKETARFLGYFDKKIDNKKISPEHLKILQDASKLRYEELKTLTYSQFFIQLEKAKNARYAKSKPALLTGTLVHELIQKSIEGRVRYKIENIIHKNEQVQYEVRNCYQAWLNWEKQHEVEYYATELVIGNQELFLSGTIDVVAKVDTVMQVLDLKTSKQVSSDVYLQTALYLYILKKMLTDVGLKEPYSRSVLRLDKGMDTNNMRKENFKPTHEYVLVQSDYGRDVACAMGLYETYKWKRYQDKMNFLNKKRYFVK